MTNPEKLCLQWNEFKQNISTSFGDLRGDKDFTDVTLACEDGQQVEAHKVILAASSPFFKKLLRENNHPHPLVYMRALESEHLNAIMDFLYFGEAKVLQENLNSFLTLAEELQLKGLSTGTDEIDTKDQEIKTSSKYKEFSVKNEKPPKIKDTAFSPGDQPFENSDTTTVGAGDTNTTVNASLEDLDAQIRSMITKSDVSTGKGKLATCNICGKNGLYISMPRHIEANHITGVSHACEICGTISRSRDGVRQHKMKKHAVL